ncbi:MAG: hypothetical protein AMJ79_11330 [Phycisphaerae bacterium SM23_30]|nr:MAG: hypothetical protein AMJ79_11330 [Phycisphaerae bacterium SM23_30]
MNYEVIFDAIASLGLPVVIAVILVWNLVKLNKSLTAQNNNMQEELSKLREAVSNGMNLLANTEKLLQQNELLVEAIRKSEKDSMELVRQWVGYIIGEQKNKAETKISGEKADGKY